MCKPWKHGIEEQNKPSERRKLQKDKDAEDTDAYDSFLSDLRIQEALDCYYYDECRFCEKGEAPE
jgi:hypothetical protein